MRNDPINRLNLVLDNPNLSIDDKLLAVVDVVDQTFPELLEHTPRLSNDEIETLFVRFVMKRDPLRDRAKDTLLALTAAAELKIRADRAGITALEYAGRIRVTRELNGG